MGGIWEPLLSALIAVLAAAVPVLAAKAWAYLEERIKASAVDRLGQAAERAAGQVIEALDGSAAVDSAMQAAKTAAIDTATVALMRSMAQTIERLGGTPAQVEAMIRGEIGKAISRAPAAASSAPLLP